MPWEKGHLRKLMDRWGIQMEDKDWFWVCEFCAHIRKNPPTKECDYCDCERYHRTHLLEIVYPNFGENHIWKCERCGYTGNVSVEEPEYCCQCRDWSMNYREYMEQYLAQEGEETE